MDSVSFDGREYTKASVLAEKFRYTQDYLGQLCRAKKVDARLVGRAWYVNLESLTAHKDARYKPTQSIAEISPKKAINNYLSRVDVEPILKQKTVKIFRNNSKGALTELPVKYEVDDYALIPKVHKAAVSVNVPIIPAEAELLHVSKRNREDIRFEPEELPEVSLRGTLKVAGLPEIMHEVRIPEEEPEAAPEEEDLPVHEVVEKKPVVRPRIVTIRPVRPKAKVFETISASEPVMVKKVSIDVVRAVPEATHHSSIEPPVTVEKKANSVPVTTVSAPQFKPALVVEKEKRADAVPVSSPLSFVVPVTTVLAALAVGILIISTNTEVLADGSSYDAHYVVQTANLVSFYERLPW